MRHLPKCLGQCVKRADLDKRRGANPVRPKRDVLHQAGNEETAKLLAHVVDVVDGGVVVVTDPAAPAALVASRTTVFHVRIGHRTATSNVHSIPRPEKKGGSAPSATSQTPYRDCSKTNQTPINSKQFHEKK